MEKMNLQDGYMEFNVMYLECIMQNGLKMWSISSLGRRTKVCHTILLRPLLVSLNTQSCKLFCNTVTGFEPHKDMIMKIKHMH